MAEDRMRRHTLTGFPNAAIRLLLALEDDRQHIASNHGISAIELKSLFRIAAAGSLTPKQLAENLSMTTGAITGISTRLVAAGLLHRVAHPNDRRSLYLELTEAGHRTMAVIHAEFNEMVSDATVGITADEFAVTIEMLRRVTSAIRARLEADLD
ncbi:MAG: MarR family transcriptional regulator [Microbacteriaceae bacterium]|nr:MarR family transcriptional regulator [Microbacteriaceae bacterium]